jgi:glycerol-3-phosphate dehydrogenase subunit B
VKADLHYDVVVVGVGVAGLTTATLLAEAGARVCVLAKGTGSTHLAPGTIDVLGYDPEPVEAPLEAAERLVAARPDHPYARAGLYSVLPAVGWLADRVAAGPLEGYAYVGRELDRNHRLPTAAGALRPSGMVPQTMAAGDGAGGERTCFVGFRSLRDFHARYAAGNLGAHSIELDLDLGRPDANALGLARRLEEPGFRAGLADRVARELGDVELVGLPAALGLRAPHAVWSDLERRLERRVFEVPTLPPSVPGMRLYESLLAALRAAGGRLILGSEVTGAEREGDRVTAVRAQAGGREVGYGLRHLVLATGGFTSGSLTLDADWQTHEGVLGLPVESPGPDQARFEPDYFGDHPMNRAGLAVDGSLRPAGLANVRVAGAALAGAEPWREGSGEGIALATAHRAAQAVLAEEGAAPAPARVEGTA